MGGREEERKGRGEGRKKAEWEEEREGGKEEGRKRLEDSGKQTSRLQGRVKQKSELPSAFSLPFPNSFVPRPGGHHFIQSNNPEIKTPRETLFSGHRNWGKELLPARECERNPGMEKGSL